MVEVLLGEVELGAESVLTLENLASGNEVQGTGMSHNTVIYAHAQNSKMWVCQIRVWACTTVLSSLAGMERQLLERRSSDYDFLLRRPSAIMETRFEAGSE